MEWLYYLLEANLYLLLFYGFYKLLLAKTTFYCSNRYYLILSSLTAFILPVLQLGFLKPAIIIDNARFPPPVLYTATEMVNMVANPVVVPINYGTYLYPIYLLVALFFLIKLIFSLIKIVSLWLKANKKLNGKITVVELKEQSTAFSFFNILFIHPQLAEKQTVLKHEMVHIKQKHSVDILFFEIIQIICWFNPFIYFLKKEIKLLHEYIADELSTDNNQQKHEYAMFLIENSFGVLPTPLTNQIFNQSILKRRINMLNKKRTAGWARLRLLLTLPLVTGMLCASTMAFTKSYGYVNLLPEKSKIIAPIQEISKVKNEKIKFPPPVIKQNEPKYFTPNLKQDKNTRKHIAGADKRYIIINGQPITDNSKFYGVTNAKSVQYINQATAAKTYGEKAKYGAVLITGTALRYNTSNIPKVDQIKFPPPIVKPDKKSKNISNIPKVDQIKFPPPVVNQDRKSNNTSNIPKVDQIKFPPPIVKPDPVNQHNFSPQSELKHDGKQYQIVKPDPRFIVINGEPVPDMYHFYGLSNAESVAVLTPTQAVKIYGNVKGNNGAVQIKGSSIKYVAELVGQPFPPSKISLVLDRSKGDFMIVPNTENELKTLTVYNSKGKVIYNSTNYEDNWNGESGNYNEFTNKKITPNTYTFLVKIDGKSRENKRGQVTIK